MKILERAQKLKVSDILEGTWFGKALVLWMLGEPLHLKPQGRYVLDGCQDIKNALLSHS